MNPTVVAAIIAAVVSVLTLIGTVVAQIYGIYRTDRNTTQTIEAQWGQLKETLKEQSVRDLNERFATAAGQLGSDKPAAVRLAGVYAMASLADDWEKNRQTCVDVLCGYLRMPYGPDPGTGSPVPEQLIFKSSREVRHTVIRLITAHLKDGAAVSWQGLNFDFTGVVFDGGSLRAPGSPVAQSISSKPSSPAAKLTSPSPSSPAAPSTLPGQVLQRQDQLPRREVLCRHSQLLPGQVFRQRSCQLRRRRVHRRSRQFRRGRVHRRHSQLRRRRVHRRHNRLQQCQVLRQHSPLPKRRVLRRFSQLQCAYYVVMPA
jgi:hypothetical protein